MPALLVSLTPPLLSPPPYYLASCRCHCPSPEQSAAAIALRLRLRLHLQLHRLMESTQTPPPSAGGEAETLVAVAVTVAVSKEEKAKRARRRSRYLSPPYTHHHDAATVDEEEKKADEASLLLHLHKANVATADLLSAFLQSAASAPASPDVDTDVLLRFFTLYRSSVLAKLDDAVAHRPPDAPEAPGHKRKKVTFSSDANATDCSLHPTSKKKKKKEAMKSTGHGLHFGNPAALVLHFTPYTIHLPSKEELLVAFCRFGFLIESETGIDRDARRARVVFGSSIEAETAYSCAQTLGTFGPPFATPSLQHLPPIKLDACRPAPKLPLTEMRKNLEKMIMSLTRRPSSFSKDGARNLAGEMQGLLAEVNKLLSAGPSTTTAHHH